MLINLIHTTDPSREVSIYAGIASKLNQSRLDSTHLYPLIAECREATKQLELTNVLSSTLSETYDLAAHLIDQTQTEQHAIEFNTIQSSLVKYKHYASTSENDKMSMVINGSKRYLEYQFYNYIQKINQQYHCQIGGRPTIHSKLTAFINVKVKNNNL